MKRLNEIVFNDVFKNVPPYLLYILDKKQYPILGMDEWSICWSDLFKQLVQWSRGEIFRIYWKQAFNLGRHASAKTTQNNEK